MCLWINLTEKSANYEFTRSVIFHEPYEKDFVVRGKKIERNIYVRKYVQQKKWRIIDRQTFFARPECSNTRIYSQTCKWFSNFKH